MTPSEEEKPDGVNLFRFKVSE